MRTRHQWISATTRVVEAIRSTYAAEPATTAAGLAQRYGVPLEDAVAAVMGGWTGHDEFCDPGRAPNLARERAEQYEKQPKGAGPRVHLEPALEGSSIPEAIETITYRKKRVRKGKRQRRFEQHLATYVPLVGASKRKPPIRS